MLFWLIVSTAVFFSIVFLLWVFQRDVSHQFDDDNTRTKRNVELYQQRLRRASQEVKKGYISEQDFQSLELELGRRLLRDVEQLQQAPKQSTDRRKWLLLLAVTPMFAFTLYASLGAWQDWQITEQLRQLSQSDSEEQFNQRVKALHSSLERRIERRPDNLSYRMLLADYAMNKGDYNGAAAHYGVVTELLPDDDEAWARYAQAEFMRNKRVLNANVAQAMDNALQINPRNATVLGLQGIQAAEAEDYVSAIDAWQKLLSIMPQQSPEADIIRQGIADLQERAGIEPTVIDAAILEGIEVTVSLGENYAGLDKNTAVFIYARASQGPRAPLAAVKLQLKDLPATVSLDDSKAMLEQFKLSLHEQVHIGARISFTGDAMPQDGDIRVESEAIEWREQKAISLDLN